MSNIRSIRDRLSPRGDFNRLGSVLHIRDTALTGYLIDILKDANVPIREDVESMLYEAARRFQTTDAGRHFLREAAAVRPGVAP